LILVILASFSLLYISIFFTREREIYFFILAKASDLCPWPFDMHKQRKKLIGWGYPKIDTWSKKRTIIFFSSAHNGLPLIFYRDARACILSIRDRDKNDFESKYRLLRICIICYWKTSMTFFLFFFLRSLE
jgi:hypothetical protein